MGHRTNERKIKKQTNETNKTTRDFHAASVTRMWGIQCLMDGCPALSGGRQLEQGVPF